MLFDKRNLLRNSAMIAMVSLPVMSASAQILVGDGLRAHGPDAAISRSGARLPVPGIHHFRHKASPAPSPAVAIAGPELDFWLGKKRVVSSSQNGWRYLDTEDGPLEAWTKPDFDDSKWKQGAAPLGYGENIIATKIAFGDDANNKYPAAFFRLSFMLDHATKAATETWAMRALIDDGAVVYLNGAEIQRIRMPEGKIGNTTRPAVKTGASSGLEHRHVTFDIPPKAFTEGKNVLCVSVHQADGDSSDLVLDVELIGISAREFAVIDEKEKAAQARRAQAALAAAANQAAQAAVIRPAQPANVLTIFDSRIKPQLSRLKHMLRALPVVIGISNDQVEELILASGDAFQRLRDDVDRRANAADQAAHNRLRSEIYQNRISLTNDDGLIETFAAILTPAQLQRYSTFVASREEQRLSTTIDMFYANLDCGLFFTADQHPEMLRLLREIALDPANANRGVSSNNPISGYYKVQNGFTQAVRQNDPRIKKILTARQLQTLNDGVTTGAIYGGGFINVDSVLVPEEK